MGVVMITGPGVGAGRRNLPHPSVTVNAMTTNRTTAAISKKGLMRCTDPRRGAGGSKARFISEAL